MTVPPILWRPTADRIERATITAYTRWLEQTRGLEFAGYAAVGMVDDRSRGLLGVGLGALRRGRVGAVRAHPRLAGDAGRGMAAGRAPQLRRARAAHAERRRRRDPARVGAQAAGRADEGELREEVARLAGGLRALGVGPGDRVVAYLPNIPEAIAAFLACASIGAIWSSCSPDFGARSVIDRFSQIEPRVLLAVDGYRYGGKDFDRMGVVQRAPRRSADGRAHGRCSATSTRTRRSPASSTRSRWEELRARGEGAALSFEQLPSDHPLWVLYSSGTTGLPKAIVHGHGGMMLETLKKMNLHVDLHADDRLFWFTTTGWMMWNFVIGALTTDASIVLYDGNPGTPDMGVLWDLAERPASRASGRARPTSAAVRKRGCGPPRAEISRRCARWARPARRCRRRASPGSTTRSGGHLAVLDLGRHRRRTAFVGGVPTLPVYKGELQARALGARVEAWSPEGKPLINEVGELVVTEPMPSMPLYFWGDPDGSRFRESYFDMFPGVWRHGDWIEITDRGTAIISGRSDATINRGGIRMGTSEIYGAVLTLDEVVDALVLDLPLPGTDGFMPLFVVLRDGATLDDELVARIRTPHPRGLLAAPCTRHRRTDRRGAAHALRQGARAARQADPPRRRPRHDRQS